MRLICKGKGSFFIQASNSDMGWNITKCDVLVQQGDQPLREITTSKSLPRSPYKVSYNLPLIAETIAETPMAANKVLRQVLEPFGRAYCFTDAIIQGARTDARRLIFGDADDNVTYALFLKEDLEKAGHHVELYFTTRKETMINLDKSSSLKKHSVERTQTLMVFYLLTAKLLFFSGGRNTTPKSTNDWGHQQMNYV